MSRPDRYHDMFERLQRREEGAFIPYLTLGDPDPESTVSLADRAIEAGADALELGMPFSDPIADGPTIQASVQRAIEAGMTPRRALEAVAEIRDHHPDVPIGLLTYSHLVFSEQTQSVFERAAEAGADSILLADVPTLEAPTFAREARRAGLEFVMIVPPNASESTVRRAAEWSSGYIYVVTRDGPTGTERAARAGHHPHLAQLDELGAPPAIVGFGVSRPEHVTDALRAGARGVISGSAVIQRMEPQLHDRPSMLDSLETFVGRMKASTRLG